MSRITEIEIAGTKYPLNFSTKAAKKIAEKYGSVEDVDKVFANKSVADMMDECVWLLSVLIEQGTAYIKLTEDEEIKPLLYEDLEVLVGIPDIPRVKDAILEAFTSGTEREVEVESPNAKTTQDK